MTAGHDREGFEVNRLGRFGNRGRLCRQNSCECGEDHHGGSDQGGSSCESISNLPFGCGPDRLAVVAQPVCRDSIHSIPK